MSHQQGCSALKCHIFRWHLAPQSSLHMARLRAFPAHSLKHAAMSQISVHKLPNETPQLCFRVPLKPKLTEKLNVNEAQRWQKRNLSPNVWTERTWKSRGQKRGSFSSSAEFLHSNKSSSGDLKLSPSAPQSENSVTGICQVSPDPPTTPSPHQWALTRQSAASAEDFTSSGGSAE